MTEAAFLLLVFVWAPVLTIALIINMSMMRRRDPAPPGGWPAWQPPPVVPQMQMTVLAGPVCAPPCGGPLHPVTYDQASGMPSVLRCQACGMESVLGPWAVLRERA